MIRNGQDIAHLVGWIEGPGCVGNETDADIEAAHDVNGQDGDFHVVPFVRVKAAAKTNGRDGRLLLVVLLGLDDNVSKDDFPLVSRHSAVGGEPGDILVRDGEFGFLESFAESGKARSANDSDLGQGQSSLGELFLEVVAGEAVRHKGLVFGIHADIYVYMKMYLD